MAAEIKKELPNATIKMIRGSGGVYTIVADGEELWNKQASGRGFPDESVMVDLIVAKAD